MFLFIVLSKVLVCVQDVHPGDLKFLGSQFKKKVVQGQFKALKLKKT